MSLEQQINFQKTVLKNGLSVYSHYDPSVQVVHMSLITPVGTCHNHGQILPGTFHFLEHLAAARSKKFPILRSGPTEIKIRGGSFGAATYPKMTSYDARIATNDAEIALEVLTNSFFYPLITNEFIHQEKGIIANERKRRECFYPSNSESGQYLNTKWMKKHPYSVEQIFGSDHDFEKMDTDYFINVHQNYYATPASYFIIAGNFDLDVICKKLETIPLPNQFNLMDSKRDPISWNQRDYHSFETKEVSRFEYHLGWLYRFDDTSLESTMFHRVMNQSLNALAVSVFFGGIFDWLRNQKQWLYEVKNSGSCQWGDSSFFITCPLNSMEQVAIVRSEIKSRFYNTINEKSIEMLKKQRIGERVFQFQTVGAKLDMAKFNLQEHQQIPEESLYIEMIQNLSTKTLRDFFDKHVAENFGEVLLIPKK